MAVDCGGSEEYQGPTTEYTPSSVNIITPVNRLSQRAVQTAANAVVKYINNKLTDPCKREVLSEIIGGSGSTGDALGGTINQIVRGLNQQYLYGQLLDITVTEESWDPTSENGDYTPDSPYGGELRLNTKALKDAGREYIAAILIHEFVPAYMSTFQANGARPMGPLQQHEAMVAYIQPMAGFLNSRYRVPMDDAIALSWGGLHETNAWKSDLSEEYRQHVIKINQDYKNGKGSFKCPKE